ncbi:MAG: succinate dehydrogenase cytochrome b subunit [Bacteroidota bacterium]
MTSVFTSSIGKKLLMSLAGFFLVLFLLVHMSINLLLILADDSMVYNRAAHFMSTNLAVKVFEVVLFGGLLLHIIYALILQVQNWISRPKGYRRNNHSQESFFSKYMIHTAAIIFVFLAIHMMDFYFKAKFGHAPEITFNGVRMHDFASEVQDKFHISGFVIFYIAAFIFLGFHLVHGFHSFFKTIGIGNKKLSTFFEILAVIYAIIIVGGFSAIPLFIYF